MDKKRKENNDKQSVNWKERLKGRDIKKRKTEIENRRNKEGKNEREKESEEKGKEEQKKDIDTGRNSLIQMRKSD